jgi:GNAT superfamily N-acetyltransferase
MHIEKFINLPAPIESHLKKNVVINNINELTSKINDNTFNVLDVPFFNVSFSPLNPKILFVAFENNQIVGLLCLEYSEEPYHSLTKCQWSMKNIGVSKSHQRRHISTDLIQSMFETAKELGISGIYQTHYSDLGWKRTKDNFAKYASLYPEIKFIDGKRRFE